MISARWIRHLPVKDCIVGWRSQKRESASVHSPARPLAHTGWQPALTLQ